MSYEKKIKTIIDIQPDHGWLGKKLNPIFCWSAMKLLDLVEYFTINSRKSGKDVTLNLNNNNNIVENCIFFWKWYVLFKHVLFQVESYQSKKK